MNVFVIGGTGLLGYHAIKKLLNEGYSIKTLALPPLPSEELFDNKVEIILNDIHELSNDKIIELFKEQDILLYAAGKDERHLPDKPAINYYRHHNVEPIKRILPLAKQAGIKKVIVLGSYYTYFDRIWPKMDLANHHPYIKSRKEQLEIILKNNEPDFETILLELPIVFGTMPGKVPTLKEVIDKLESQPKVFAPMGGTAMITTNQVKDAIYGAIKYGKGGICYPIGGSNMTWSKLLEIIIDKEHEIKSVYKLPKIMFTNKRKQILQQQMENGKESGLHPVEILDLEAKKMYIDNEISMTTLGYKMDDIEYEIEKTVDRCMKERKRENEKIN